MLDNSTKYEIGKMVQGYNGCIWERKYETDSISAFLKLSRMYYEYTEDSTFYDDNFVAALNKVYETFENQ